MQELMERFGVLPEETVAFQKERGCDDITYLLVGTKEDALEFVRLLLLLLEDEEKFRDRVGAEKQARSLLLLGFPEHVFVEFKIEEMQGRKITTIAVTRQGTTFADQLIGLLQGVKMGLCGCMITSCAT
jgi:hypothetical protein